MSISELSIAGPLCINVLTTDESARIIPAGELDLASAPALDQEVRELRRTGTRHFTVDMRRLTFLDSTGLRMLITLRNEAKLNGEQFVLMPGPRNVERLFDITSTRRLFEWGRS
jgi:anti-anti-sigma factor